MPITALVAARTEARPVIATFTLKQKNLEPGSPEWWLARLSARLDERIPEMERFESYYNGYQPLEFATQKFRQAFGDLFADFADNFAALVVDAVDERLDIEGFRMPTDGQPDERADDKAWEIWQANHLDAESQLAHIDSLVKGCAYIHVSPFRGDWVRDVPLITIEDALQCYVEMEPGGRRRRRAGLRRWLDDSGYLFANVYLPDGLYKFQTSNKALDASGRQRVKPNDNWQARQDPLFDADGRAVMANGEQAAEPWPLPYPDGLEVVPIIPLPNRARLSGEGKSELSEVPPLQDAINKACSDMLLASEFGAFGQKYITNFRLKVDPVTGNPEQPFKIGVDRLLVTGPPEEGDPEPRFGEFTPTPLDGYAAEAGMLIQHLASITRTPPHYFLANMGNFPSGEALRAAEAGLVTKARRRQRVFGEAWEEAMRLAFQLLSDPRGNAMTSETIWRDPETRTEAEHVDAQLKQHSLGVPLRQIWENLGYTPTQVDRFAEMRAEEATWEAGAPVAPPSEPAPPAS